MNRIMARAIRRGVAVTAAAGIALLASSGAHPIVLDVYLLCIGAVILLALVRVTRAQASAQRASPFDVALAAMRSNVVPGIRTLEQAAPECAELPLSRAAQSPRSQVALVLCRGFAGTDAALLVRASTA